MLCTIAINTNNGRPQDVFHAVQTQGPQLDHSFNVFTARRYASTVYAMALCPSVCLSVTSQCSTKTAQHNYSVAR